jgi:A/G-specific adenine glycosylase
MDYAVQLKRTLPNPSRRSRHHVRQSPFEGSKRQRRARLLRAVLGEPGGPAEVYADAVGIDAAKASELLEELAREGFVVSNGGVWTVPGA